MSRHISMIFLIYFFRYKFRYASQSMYKIETSADYQIIFFFLWIADTSCIFRSSVRYYNKLGFRTYDGAWTGMLGALIDNNIDVALELVTSHSSQHQDIDFIFPIAETM